MKISPEFILYCFTSLKPSLSPYTHNSFWFWDIYRCHCRETASHICCETCVAVVFIRMKHQTNGGQHQSFCFLISLFSIVLPLDMISAMTNCTTLEWHRYHLLLSASSPACLWDVVVIKTSQLQQGEIWEISHINTLIFTFVQTRFMIFLSASHTSKVSLWWFLLRYDVTWLAAQNSHLSYFISTHR